MLALSRWPSVCVRATARGSLNPGRFVGAGPVLVEAGGPPLRDAGERGLFAARALREGEPLIRLARGEVFSARALREQGPAGNNRLRQLAFEVLEGYGALREAQPGAFGELELATLLWCERRAAAASASEDATSEWLEALPDCCHGTAPFLGDERVRKAMVSEGQLAALPADFTRTLAAEALRTNKVVDVFVDSLALEMGDALETIEEDDSLVWGRGDEVRQNLPFSELFREELSLVLSRSIPDPFAELDPAAPAPTRPASPIEPRALALPAILPWVDFCNFSHWPNAALQRDGETVALTASRAIEQDEEITMPFPDELFGRTFVGRYGFVLPPKL
jgi:hypothetical protein